MYKSFLLGFIILVTRISCAQNFPSHEKSNVLTLKPKVGYSISKTSFNIAGNEIGTNPNILSELIWSSTHALETGLELNYENKRFSIKAEGEANQTLMGTVSDIDYEGDNRTQAYSKTYSRNNKGLGYSLLLKPGFNIYQNNNITLTSFLSVDYSYKKLHILNDKDWDNDNPRYIDNLNSYYTYKFPNYGIGMSLSYTPQSKWSSSISIEGLKSNYYAYGNWNNNPDFEKPISFEHKGKGRKIKTSAALFYNLSQNISLGLRYSFSDFFIHNGKDFLYTKSRGILKAKLNDAGETKHSILASFQFTFP